MSIESYPNPNGVLTSLIWRKTMSGAETSLSGYDNASQALSYTPGQEQVYLNGILLVRGDDYLATTGTSITGLSALTASDFIQVNCYNNFSVATTPATSITGTIANNQLANSAITINGSAISLGGTVTLAGDIESVTAGTGLTGGGNSGAVTLSLDTTSVISPTIVNAKGDILTASADNVPAILSLGNNGETLVADSSTSTGLRYQGNVAGGKNVIINGGFDIWQRGITFTSTGNGLYSADRYIFQSQNGGTATQDTTSLPNGFRYGWKFTSTATNSYMQSGQQIEFQNMENLQNNTVVISFYAKANNSNAGSTALTVRTRTSATVDGAALFTASNTDTSVTLTTSYVRYFVTRTFTTFGAVSLEFVLGANVSTDGFTITGIQMELGSVATAFSKAGGTLQGELAACQRYLPAFRGEYSPLNGWFTSTTGGNWVYNFAVPARVAPTGITISAVGDFQLVNKASAAVSPTAITWNYGGTSTASVTTVHTAGSPTAAQGEVGFLRASTSSAYILFTGCEL